MHWYKASAGTSLAETSIAVVSTPITVYAAYFASDGGIGNDADNYAVIRLTAKSAVDVILCQIDSAGGGNSFPEVTTGFWEAGANPIDLGTAATYDNLDMPKALDPDPATPITITLSIQAVGAGQSIPKGTFSIKYQLGT